MSSRKGVGRSSFAAVASSSPKGKSTSPYYGNSSGSPGVGGPNLKIDQLSHEVADISIDSAQDGDWEVFSKKSKSRAGTGAPKQWGPQNSAPKAWGHPDAGQNLGVSGNSGIGKNPSGAWQAQPAETKRSVGRVNTKPQMSNRSLEHAYAPNPTTIAPPLQRGWQPANRAGSSQSKAVDDTQGKLSDLSKHNRQGSAGYDDSGSDTGASPRKGEVDDDNDDDGMLEDTDDDILSDDFDSDGDGSQKSHESRKKNKWFKPFFDELDKLTVDEISEPSRQWHCPACRNGPGAIDWYRGLHPLMAHAKTKGASRVRLHRELAELLDEELSLRGASIIPAGETFGKWKGLRGTVSDHEIVWPPMVVVMNTVLEKDENDKWIGMGNQELLDYFSSYKATKARHSYGPHGHRGVSVLIFESTAMGYVEAERLHKHFADQGRDRDAWDHCRMPVYHGGKRQLYGFMARKEDLDNFNRHCQGKSRLKFEMRSYIEMVVEPMKQMSEDNQQLHWFKNIAVTEKNKSRVLKESFNAVSEKLRETMEENCIVRLRTKEQHEQNKEEMDLQEQFYKDQISKVYQALEEKERAFENLLQEQRKKVKESNRQSGTKEESKLRGEEKIAKFIETQAKDIEMFETEREKLIKELEDKKAELKRRQMEEELALEKEFTDALTKLMERHSRQLPESGSGTTNIGLSINI